MIAHLYRIRADFRNVPDKIIIKAKAKENFPGTWLHAEVELPDFIRAAETEAGDGFLFTQDETIMNVYIEDAERLDGIYYGVPGGGAYDERFGVLCAAGEPARCDQRRPRERRKVISGNR